MIEIIEHTADIRLRITAPTREDLFREAIRGTIALLPRARPPFLLLFFCRILLLLCLIALLQRLVRVVILLRPQRGGRE